MFTNPKPAGWTDGVDNITGLQIGTIATQLVNAVDGVGGGTYTLGGGNQIHFVGGGGDWLFDCAVTFGSTSVVKLNGASQWLTLASRTVTIDHPFKFMSVVLTAGAGSTPSAQVADSDLTATIGGLTVAAGSIISPPGASSAGGASYFILEIPRPPDGSVFASVVLKTKGITGGAAIVFPKYTLVTMAPGAAPVAIGTVDVVDTHSVANWTTTAMDQTLTPTATTTVDQSAKRYGVLVKNPYDVGIGASGRIYSVVAAYTVTSQRV